MWSYLPCYLVSCVWNPCAYAKHAPFEGEQVFVQKRFFRGSAAY